MKIVHISEAFGGGLRSAIVGYIAAAPEHEHSLFVRTREGHETLDVPETANMNTYDGAMGSFFAAARRFVLAGDYDIVHLHSSYAGLLRGMLPRGTRIIYSPHCYALEADHPPIKRAVYWSVERVLARRTQMLMAVSPREVEIGHRLRASMPSREVPNAALPMAPATCSRPATVGRPRVVMIGRIAPQKDPKFFADVCRRLGSDRYEFVWIGEGAEGREHLEDAGVAITGWLTPDQTRSVLRSADLYLHSAAWEGAPLSTLEAADTGCPVISRAIASMESLGYPSAGLTPAQAATTVERFFTDPAFAASVRERTAQIAVDYGFDAMARHLRQAYTFAGSRLSSHYRRSSAARNRSTVVDAPASEAEPTARSRARAAMTGGSVATAVAIAATIAVYAPH